MVQVLLLAGGVWLFLAFLALCLCCAAARADDARPSRHVVPGATVGLLLAASTAVAAPAEAEAAECRGGDVEFEAAPGPARAALLCELNHARKRHGAGQLRIHGALGKAAQRHAADMRRRGYFAHESPGGQDVGDRVQRAGYARAGCSWSAGEILAWGVGSRSTPARLVDAWLDSPPHRRLLLSDRYGSVGIGLRGGTPSGRSGVTAAAVLGSRSC